jgi:hypothetical protein
MSQRKQATGRRSQKKSRLILSKVMDTVVPHDRIPSRQPELKHLDVTSGGYVTGVSYAGAIVSLSDIAAGAAGNQRTGDSVRVRAVDFQLSTYYQGTSTGLRVVVFAWNISSSIGAPTAGQVLQGVGVTPQTLAAPYTSDSVEQGRLNILCDEFLPCSSAGPGVARLTMKKEVQLPINYDASATTGAGKIYALFISDAALAANAPNYQYWMRLMYEDY